MATRRQTLIIKSVFLDSSVLFTATNSPTSGSAKLFTLKNINLTTSRLVLTETERNVRKKLQHYHLQRFFNLVNATQILNQKPNLDLISKAKNVIEEKDSVILAQAKLAKSNFLVTLDKKDFLNEKVAIFLKPTLALTPKDLIEFIEKR